jgi:hypothetical protein
MKSSALGYVPRAACVKMNRSRIIPSARGVTIVKSRGPEPARAEGPVRFRGRTALLVAALAGTATASAQPPAVPPPADAPPSVEAQADVRLLVDTSLAVARKTLSEQGDFHPFAFFMKADGGLQRLTPKANAALPEPDAMLQLLQQSFRERAAAGECRAVAVVADVVIAVPGGGQSDALQIGFEHRSGWCRNFFYPFEKSPEGEIRFQKPISGHRAGAVFPDCR